MLEEFRRYYPSRIPRSLWGVRDLNQLLFHFSYSKSYFFYQFSLLSTMFVAVPKAFQSLLMLLWEWHHFQLLNGSRSGRLNWLRMALSKNRRRMNLGRLPAADTKFGIDKCFRCSNGVRCNIVTRETLMTQ